MNMPRRTRKQILIDLIREYGDARRDEGIAGDRPDPLLFLAAFRRERRACREIVRIVDEVFK